MFSNMQDWTDIRRAVLVEGASKRSICRRYGIAHKTLQKILAWPEPPGYRQQTPRPKSKLGPRLGVIEEILATDREAPAKQRHTAKRIFERLRDEHGYSGGLTQVRVTVARLRRHAGEVFVPLAHLPGRAQFDFGSAHSTEAEGDPRPIASAVRPSGRGRASRERPGLMYAANDCVSTAAPTCAPGQRSCAPRRYSRRAPQPRPTVHARRDR